MGAQSASVPQISKTKNNKKKMKELRMYIVMGDLQATVVQQIKIIKMIFFF